jgi:O-antigen/teichoic acid export membrane protein
LQANRTPQGALPVFSFKTFLTSVGRNSGAITLSGAAAKFATFVVIVLASRSLPRQQFGAYALVLATSEIIRVVAAFGVDQVSLRSLAREGGREPGIVSNALALKMLTSVLATVLFAIAGWFLHFTPEMWISLGLLSADFFLGSAALSLVTFHQSRMRADRAAPALLLGAAAGLLTGIAAFAVKAPMPFFQLSLPVASAVSLLVLWVRTRRWVRPSLDLVSLASLREFAGTAWPIAGTGIIVLLYFRISTLMLDRIQGLGAVASYTTAYKLSEALLLLAVALSATTLPMLSAALRGGPGPQGVRAYRSSVLLVTALTLPFGIFCTFFGRFVVVSLWGPTYAGSALAFSVLVWATVLMAINMQTTNALLALNRERLILLIATVNLAVNVTVNLALIPRFSFTGSAVATLVTEGINLLMQLLLVSRLLRPASSGRPIEKMSTVG